MIISNQSRMLQKALSSAGVPFTIPVSSDFSDGSWIPTDLADRELGINLADGRLFVRIGATIHEVDLDGSGGGGISQVNSDWTATTGVANILNKPTIPTAVSQLTQDVSYIEDVAGLIDVDSTLSISGTGTPGDPYVLGSAIAGVQTERVFGYTVGTTTPLPGSQFLTIPQTGNSVVSIVGDITLKDAATGASYMLTLKGISDLIGGTISNKVVGSGGVDFNVSSNNITVVSTTDSTNTYYYLRAASTPIAFDLVATYTMTTI